MDESEDEAEPAGGDGAGEAERPGRSVGPHRWRRRRPRWRWTFGPIKDGCFPQASECPEEFAGAHLSLDRGTACRGFFARSERAKPRGPEVHSEGMGGASVSFTAIRRPYQECWDSSYVDQLNNDQPQAAKATALLAIASLDQAAIDQGNWPLASEFAMQPSPPFSAFQRPRALDPLEARQTKLTDPRWISVFMARLKERDAFHTAKRNLSGPGSGGSGVSDVPPGSRRESLRREVRRGAKIRSEQLHGVVAWIV